MEIKFNIFRKDDDSERYQEYNLDITSGMSISECLMAIKHKQDGTLSFRVGCRNGICGICALKVNGKPVLGCKTKAINLLKNNQITIEPLDNLPIIKDLIVDMEPFFDCQNQIQPWLEETNVPETENLMSQKETEILDKVSSCIQCGACYSTCEVIDIDKEFVGPASIIKNQRYKEDKRDNLNRTKQQNKEHNVWDCTNCVKCDDVCPEDIAPLKVIKEIRKQIINKKYNSKGVTHHKSFLKSIEKNGLLNEAIYPLQAISYNIFRLKEILPVGLRLIKKGKAPDFIQKPIKKLSEVKRLFKEVKE